MSLRELFLRPEWLPLLALVPIAWLLLWGADRLRARGLVRSLGSRAPALTADLGAGRRRTRRTLRTAALLLALLALLQPVWGEGPRRAERRGVDVVIGLDVSRSMLARDLPPSRLASAKREIRTLAEHVRGDRLALVVFAGEAHLAVPLTRDAAAFADLADLAGPLDVGRGGTDLGAALDAALEALSGGTGSPAVVLLLTDGEDLEGRGLRVARTCAERDVTVHCVGFGSERGSKIAIEGEGGEAFLRDRAGREVVSAMDPVSLREIAEAAGGEFVDAGIRPLPLLDLYEKRILAMPGGALEADGRRERTNRFQWPLLLAFLLWIMEMGLSDRMRR